MKILITGACGYHGSKLVPILLNLNHKIVAVDTQWFGNYLTNHKNLKIIKKNILDLEKQDLKNIDAIIHLASIANDPMGDIKQELTWEISCLATMKLMENDDLGIPEWLVELRAVSRGCRALVARAARPARA